MSNNEGPSMRGDPNTHPCGFCDGRSTVIEDSDRRRLYECSGCGAIEYIGKSTVNLGWWYFGWEHQDGRRLRAPTTGEMNRKMYGWQPDDPRPPTLSFDRFKKPAD